MGWMGVAVAALLSASPPWPDGQVDHLHGFGLVDFGACVRWNTPVAGGGPCGEVAFALDLPVSWKWRLGLELGAGFLPTTTLVDPDVTRSSGGPAYGALRLLGQFDVSDDFFVRGGMQVRTTLFFHQAVGGAHGFIEVGTRGGSWFEFGLRTYLGLDGMWSTVRPKWQGALAMDAQFVIRVRVW